MFKTVPFLLACVTWTFLRILQTSSSSQPTKIPIGKIAKSARTDQAGDLKGLAYKQNSTETHENHNTTTLLGLLPGELRISFVFWILFLGCRESSIPCPWSLSLVPQGSIFLFFPEYRNLLGRPPGIKPVNIIASIGKPFVFLLSNR